MKHIMLRAIFQLFFNAEFVCSVGKYQPPSEARERFLDRERAEPENINYKFYFAPKLSSICINQNCSM